MRLVTCFVLAKYIFHFPHNLFPPRKRIKQYHSCIQNYNWKDNYIEISTMKHSNILLLISAIVLGSVAAESTLINSTENSKSLHQRIRDERRFVLFNSRRLTGECCKLQTTQN